MRNIDILRDRHLNPKGRVFPLGLDCAHPVAVERLPSYVPKRSKPPPLDITLYIELVGKKGKGPGFGVLLVIYVDDLISAGLKAAQRVRHEGVAKCARHRHCQALPLASMCL